jgi:thioredoxin 1
MSIRTSISATLIAITLFFYACSNGVSQNSNTTISAKEFAKKLNETANAFVLDVRTPEEFETGHLKTATNINFYDGNFSEQIALLDKQKTIFVYCKGGGRSAQAASQLTSAGFKNVVDLDGGIMAWDNENLPVVTTSNTPPTDKFTQQDYDKLLAENKFLLIDFYATWCISCKKMEPSIQKISKEFEANLVVKRIDVDEAPSLCKALKIEGIPVIAIYKNGTETKRTEGFKREEELRKMIQ